MTTDERAPAKLLSMSRLLVAPALGAAVAVLAAGCPAPPTVVVPQPVATVEVSAPPRGDGGVDAGKVAAAASATPQAEPDPNDPAVRLARLHAKACEGDTSRYPAVVAKYEAEHAYLFQKPDPIATAAEDKKLCDSGDACQRLASDYDQGFGVPRSAARAAALYKIDCEQMRGFTPLACWRFADHLATGNGVPRNARRAVDLYENVCVNGMYGSCLTLADMIRAGDGAKRDDAHAFEVEGVATRMFQSCCFENGDPSCCQAAAMGFREGRGVGQDEGTARALETAAAIMGQAECERGISRECYDLGQRYALGRGVDKDAACAEKLFAQACAGKHAAACKPPAPSAPPEGAEWAGVGEVVVKNSTALGCETKMIREWLRVRCAANNPKDAPVDTRVVEGGNPLEMFAERGKGEVTLLVAVRAGTEIEARVVWPKTGVRTLRINWPKGAKGPTMGFERGR
ncbi:MAG: tetratricopeptide repeat protein [Minicystis sp.]